MVVRETFLEYNFSGFYKQKFSFVNAVTLKQKKLAALKKIKNSVDIWVWLFYSITYKALNMPPSSRGLGHFPFTEVTGIRIPLGVLIFFSFFRNNI